MDFRKVFVLFIVVITVEVFLSCTKCKDIMIEQYYHCNLSLNNLDNRGRQPLESSSDTLSKSAFGLRVRIELSKVMCMIPFPSFSSNALAFSKDCPRDQFNPNDSLLSLNIITMYDFNDTLKEGSDVGSMFKILFDKELVSIEEYFQNYSFIRFDQLEDYLMLDLIMTEEPLGENSHQFISNAVLSDQTLISDTSQLVFLQ